MAFNLFSLVRNPDQKTPDLPHTEIPVIDFETSFKDWSDTELRTFPPEYNGRFEFATGFNDSWIALNEESAAQGVGVMRFSYKKSNWDICGNSISGSAELCEDGNSGSGGFRSSMRGCFGILLMVFMWV